MPLEDTLGVLFVFRMRDEISQKMQTMKQGSKELDQQLQKQSASFQQIGQMSLIAGAGILFAAIAAARAADTSGRLSAATGRLTGELGNLARTFGSAILPVLVAGADFLTGLLVILNKMPAPILQTLGVLTLFGGTLLTVGGGALLFISTIQKLIIALRGLAVAQAVASVLARGPGGIALIAAAIAGGAAVGTGINQIINAQQGVIATRPIIARIGETEPEAVIPLSQLSARQGASGNFSITFSGPILGNDQEARAFANRVHGFIREKERLGR